MTSNLQDLYERIRKAEQVKDSLLDIEQQVSKIGPIVLDSIEKVARLVTITPSNSVRGQDEIRRNLSMLLEELRVVLDEVESEAEALEAKVLTIEALHRRLR